MRALKSLIVPALFGLALLTIAIVTRSGKFARENPGAPISSAMREAMNMMTLAPHDQAVVSQRFPNHEITNTGLRYVVTAPGDGMTFPERNQTIAVHYRGTLLDGTPIDDSFRRGEPYSFQVGQAKVIPGWDEALLTMSKGEKRTLIIPHWLGYGEKGVQGHIPPEATLIFEVELVDLL